MIMNDASRKDGVRKVPVTTTLTQIRKRDGRFVDFEPDKIKIAITKGLADVGPANEELAEDLTGQVVEQLEQRFPSGIPSVEDVQDIVETTLIRNGLAEAAKAYILYRQKRAEMREARAFVKAPGALKLNINALRVLARRYLLKDDKGSVIETPEELFRRVAKGIAAAELKYGTAELAAGFEEAFYRMMALGDFIPNSPTLMNAGTSIGQLSACFVLPVGDSIIEIFDAVKDMALIHQSGGGTGFSFTRLRPEGDIVMSTKGTASGPVSFMRVFDVATDVVKQGGRRRGANMGILRCDHPDVLHFITAKARERILRNFNVSVAVTDSFMSKIETNDEYDLVNPRTGEVTRRLRAGDVFNAVVQANWEEGDPGLIFIDEINRRNQTPQLGLIESTNPCGEQVLHPYESCNLGSINLSKMIRDGDMDWDRLRQHVRLGVRFLDDVIDVNRFPLKQIDDITRGNRRIGLGVMGFAEALIMLGIAYDSDEAIAFAEKLMEFIRDEAWQMSSELGEERGSFPNFEGSVWPEQGFKTFRNATTTTIAPTGSISIIAQTTSGIEPLFAISFVRDIMEGTRLLETNPFFERVARERGFFSEELLREIAETGSVQGNPRVPEDMQRLFVTALDIKPEWHVRIQAAFQKFTDNAVSKTINLREDAPPGDIAMAYRMAYDLKCKGITVFRYGSKTEQVLYINPSMAKKAEEEAAEYVTAKSEFAGGCPYPVCPV